MNTHFKIIIPFYNVENWTKACIRSVKRQDYDNYQCIIVDDMSTDNSLSLVLEETKDDEKFLVVENTEKKYALRNIYEAIEISKPLEDDVIVTLDGDDWFAGTNILTKLNDTYQQEKCLLTYGSYAEYPSGRRGKFSRKIPDTIIKESSYRKNEWNASHLRTFKYKLWKKILKEDLLDSSGKFYEMAWDLSFMFPMLEMAGERSKYIDDILYIYNIANPINDHKVNHEKQLYYESLIRSKNPYRTWKEE